MIKNTRGSNFTSCQNNCTGKYFIPTSFCIPLHCQYNFLKLHTFRFYNKNKRSLQMFSFLSSWARHLMFVSAAWLQLHFRTNSYLYFLLTWQAPQCLYAGKGASSPGAHSSNLAVLFLTLGKPRAHCAHGEKDNPDGWPPWITTTLRLSTLLLSPTTFGLWGGTVPKPGPNHTQQLITNLPART